jgi:NitT/TauT family transport system substrate-binding protein
VFSLAWSEYPSWRVFGVAASKGLIDGKEGALGELEKKWGVDVKLDLLEYDLCIKGFGARNFDAVCITNIDVLGPALKRRSVAILPTSSSHGADACIVVAGIKDVEDLKQYKTYVLKESVSEYAFVRNLERLGKDAKAYPTTRVLHPSEAAAQMQAKVADVQAIMVWNPFVLQTLKARKDARVLFDSTAIPEEIVDLVVAGDDALQRPGGQAFACCVIDCYYAVNAMLADPAQRDELLLALGGEHSNLDLAEMKKACEQTHFYKTPAEALELLGGAGKLSKRKFADTMKAVVAFCTTHQYIERAPRVAFGADAGGDDVDLRFDPSFIQVVKDKK